MYLVARTGKSLYKPCFLRLQEKMKIIKLLNSDQLLNQLFESLVNCRHITVLTLQSC